MASTLDLSGLTLNPQEVEDVAQAIFEAVYVKGRLSDYHDVRNGIQMKTQIPIFGLMGLVGKLDTGCGVNAATNQISTSQKYWEPKMIGFRLTHCQNDIDELYKMWKKSMIAKGVWEQIENGQIQFMTDRTLDAALESQLLLSSFGDTAAGNVTADGGVITDGVDKTFFTPIDGLWKQIFTGVTAGDITKVAISENSAVSYALQDALSADKAYTTLNSMYNKADSRLVSDPAIKFQVTRSLYDNLQDYLESKSLSAGFLERTENGKGSGLTYRGIPIVIRYDWDRNIRAYMDNGTTYDLPHRAILTPIANIPIGTSDEESLSSLDMFYDKTAREHYTDVDYRFDIKLLEEYKIVVAY